MQKLKSDPVIFSSLIVGFFITLVFAIVILLFFHRLAPQMPLLYSIPWGENQLVTWQIITILPLVNLALLLINLTFGIILLHTEPLLARIVTIGAVLTIVLIITTSIKIILLTHL